MGISLKQLFPQFNPETEKISDGDFRNQTKINNLFQLLLEESTPLKIKLQGSNKRYSTCITDVDSKQSLITLDELHPNDGNSLLLKYGRLIASTNIKGVNISFQTALVKTAKNNQINMYSCDLPASISYVQRRQEYRVRISEPLLINMTAQHSSSMQMLQGKVYDVSMQGIAVNFSTNQSIKPLDLLTNCRLEISKKESIEFTLEVRHIESTNPGKVLIGGRFMELNARSSEIICRFVREMERASFKK